MQRRSFLRSLFASTATIVVAPAVALEALDALVPSTRTYVDMGRNAETEIDRLIREVRPHMTSVKSEAGWAWHPIIFTDDERLRTYASEGRRVLAVRTVESP